MTRRVMLAALAAMATALACVVPTDRSGEYRVVIAPVAELFAGDTVQLQARLVAPDGEAVESARLTFVSRDPAVALVTGDGRVVAAGAGTVEIQAYAPSLARAGTGRVTIRVHGSVEVDSIRPTLVRYGEPLRLYGVGLDPAGGPAAVRIDGHEAPILSFTPVDATRPDAYGVLEIIVTPPVGVGAGGSSGVAQLQSTIVVANARGGASRVAALAVDKRDRFEPNDTTPADLGVLTGRLELRGLAFDYAPAGVEQFPVDWYRFTTTAPGDWTITVRSLQGWLRRPSLQVVTGPVTYVNAAGFSGYRMDDASNSSVGIASACRGFGGALNDPRAWPGLEFLANYIGSSAKTTWGNASVLRIPLRNLPAGTHNLLLGIGISTDPLPWGPGFAPPDFVGAIFAYPETPLETQEAVRYDIEFTPGTQSLSSPDAFEPNDFCSDAPRILTLGTTAFTDSTIDLTHDAELDWEWFRIKGEVTGRLYLSTRSRTGRNPPAMLLYHPTPGMTGRLGRMTNAGATILGDLYSDIDYGPGVAVDTTEYYLSGVPNDGAMFRQGYPDLYQLRFTWIPGPIDGAVVAPANAGFQLFKSQRLEQSVRAPGIRFPDR